ncbi:cache domain-containing protein [Glutamicibacter arilaitensis]|uniref:cache domain-containing protein n=1 Tax=Glutamicibacter arilaitensis TaxID=256701 RepID=UPI003A8C987D
MSTTNTAGSNIPHSSIQSYFDELLKRLGVLRSDLEARLGALESCPGSETVDEHVQQSIKLLRESLQLPLSGAGFVAVEDYISNVQWHMAWWQGPELERRLLVAMETAGDIYPRREWFSIPISEQRVHIAGPYVDFLCTDDYTLTFTSPVLVGGKAVGIAGFDLLVADFEEPMSRMLQELDPRATVINSHGKVLASASAQLACGARLVRDWDGGNAYGVALASDEGLGQRIDIQAMVGLPLGLVLPTSD